MKKAIMALVLAGCVLPLNSSLAYAEEAAAAHYSVTETKNGVLIDDPAAAAILKELIPSIWENQMFQSLGRDITLKEVQQYEPALTEEKLAEIQAALDKLPAQK